MSSPVRPARPQLSPAVVILRDHIDQVTGGSFHNEFCLKIVAKDGDMLRWFHAKHEPAFSFSAWLEETGYLKELSSTHKQNRPFDPKVLLEWHNLLINSDRHYKFHLGPISLNYPSHKHFAPVVPSAEYDCYFCNYRKGYLDLVLEHELNRINGVHPNLAMASQLVLTSSDGVEIPVDRDVAERSVLIHNMVEDLGEAATAEPIPIPNVNESVLKKVIEWCTHHKNDPPQSTEDDSDSRKKTTDIEEWDQKFMQVDQEMLFEIILAANYLDIKALLDVGCKTVANMIKGKSPEEIRKTFNIQNDFTPEEEDQIRRENEWAEDR